MPTPITYTNTSITEMQAILAAFTGADGQVDYTAMANAIKTGDARYSLEDLITTYVEAQGILPEFMMAPASYIDSPDYHENLWQSDNVETAFAEIGTSHQNLRVALSQFNEAFGTSGQAATSGDDLLDEINRRIAEMDLDELEDDIARNGDNPLGIDWKAWAAFYMRAGNIGAVVLMYTIHLKSKMDDLAEAALTVIDDANVRLDELQGELEDLNMEDQEDSARAQRIQQQMSMINTVIQTMNQFIQQSQNTLQEEIQLSSNLSDAHNRNNSMIISKMGRN